MIDPLLAICARAESHLEQLRQLKAQAEQYEDWPGLPERAEKQGMAPLLYRHLKSIEFPLPDACHMALAGLTLRHRHATAIRNRILAEFSRALDEQEIEALVLKGAALANHVYPQPGLRPMRDMDILVRHADAIRAQQMLHELGFKTRVPQPEELLSSHQLPVAQRLVEGMTVSIELHHWLLPTAQQRPSQATTFEMLRPGARPMKVEDADLLTLGHEEMLWHIYRHAMAKPLISQSLRLIWVADFTSLVERYLDQIDWDRLRSVYPTVWNIMPLFHYLSPWSPVVLDRLQLVIDPMPEAALRMFEGWPESSLAAQREKGVAQILSDTFWPSEWWLQLYYGANRQSAGWWWARLVRHPLHIGGWMLKYFRERIT